MRHGIELNTFSCLYLHSHDDIFFFFFSSRRRHTRFDCDWSSDVCSSDLLALTALLLGSNFVARDSNWLRACDALGIAIVGALAWSSLRGTSLRGRHPWDYVQGGVATAVSTCVGIWPLAVRDVR